MEFPLTLSFKIFGFAPQITVTDANDNGVCYVRQKLMKFKEEVEVFRDHTKAERICQIQADRIIDFSASYAFIDEQGNRFGSVHRKGMRSIWRAHYLINDDSKLESEINEENGFVRIMDGIFGEIPLVGLFAGYVFNPTYLITRPGSEAPVLKVKKQPALFESRFMLTKEADLGEAETLRAVLGVLMMSLLERSRG